MGVESREGQSSGVEGERERGGGVKTGLESELHLVR